MTETQSAENDAQALADACEDDYRRSLHAAGLTCRDCAYVGYHCGDCGCCLIPPGTNERAGGGEVSEHGKASAITLGYNACTCAPCGHLDPEGCGCDR